MKKKPSIFRASFQNMLFLAAISMVLAAGVWVYHEYTSFGREIKSFRQELMHSYSHQVKAQVDESMGYITYMQGQTEHLLKDMIRTRVEEACVLAGRVMELNRGRLSQEELRELVRQTLRPIRFNNGLGYYFITDLDGVEILFADRPEMEGQNMLGVLGGRGEHVVRDLIALAQTSGEGFYRYHWSKPGRQGEDFEKIAFVKLFEPFGWVIGTGYYVDDMTRQIQSQVLDRLEHLRSGHDSGLFAAGLDAQPLAGPQKGQNLMELAGGYDLELARKMARLASQPQGGYLEYTHPGPDGAPAKSLAYVRGVPEWGWYVGAVVGLDALDTAVADKRRVLSGLVVKTMAYTLVPLAALVLIGYFIARGASRRFYQNYQAFIDFFSSAAKSEAAIDASAMTYAEFEELACAANQMLEAKARAQRALRAEEERYRAIFNQTFQFIGLLGLNGRFIEANGRAQELGGPADQELIGRFLWEAPCFSQSQELRAKARQAVDTALAGGHFRDTITCPGEGGKSRQMDFSLKPFYDSQGRMLYLIPEGHDTTGRMEIEEALKTSERKYRELADSLPEAVFETDVEGRFTYLNSTGLAMTGYTRADLQAGLTIYDLDPSGDKAALRALVARSLGGEHVRESEFAVRRKDGSVFPAGIYSSPIEGEGRITGFRGLGVDMTLLKTAQAERDEALKRAGQTQKLEAVATLAGGIAHEFNNLLSSIVGFTEVNLRDAPEGSLARANLERVLAAGLRARDLVRQILTFSRSGLGQMRPIMPKIMIKELLKQLGQTCPPTVRITTRLESEAMVMADLSQLHQLIQNLATNAIQAMGEAGGELAITLEEAYVDQKTAAANPGVEAGRHLRLTVSDTGPGIHEELKPRLFDPFFTTRAQGQGKGLGLSVAHGVARNHRGFIRLDPTRGQGASVEVFLPVFEP